MLKAVTILALALPFAALAQEDYNPDGMRSPVRVTAGVADQLLGQLAPDGHTLYYVTNAETSTEIYALDQRDGRSRRPFDEGAETTWPRISPDGRELAYISYRDQATGQLCVRNLPDLQRHRCLAEPGALQAEWIGADRMALVERTAQGDLQLVELEVGDKIGSRPLVPRSATSPAVSPDGRWLVYIPIDREVRQVGAGFAAHAAAKLEILRLGAAVSSARAFALALPGVTAQPSFSRDGRFLYFTQFLADTNHDGAVDAADHGLLFRVPFDGSGADPAAALSAAIPEQLTDAAWNCQYPFAGKEQLFATCTQGDTLDVFSLPLSGEIPEAWSNDRLRPEVDLATDSAQQLLLYRRMVMRARSAAGHSLGLMRLIELHLSRAEFEAAAFYAREATAAEDPAVRGLGRRLVAWVDHRRQSWERERGREVGGFAKASLERLATLEPQPGDAPPALALGHLLRSEIAQALGDLTLATEELEAVELPAGSARPLLELAYRRADSLYRLTDDRDALLRWCRKLATFPKAAADVQLRFARGYARALARGLGPADAEAAFTRELANAPAGSELAFALELARTLLAIRDEHADPHAKGARAAVLALYGRESRPDRRHLLVSDAVARASELGADQVVEALAQRYVEDALPGTAERQRAQTLYRHALLGRAFRRRAHGHYPEARADFDLVVQHTHALDALVASMDLGLRAGEQAKAIALDLGHGDQPFWVKQFGKAYLLNHELRDLRGGAFAKAVQEATAALRAGWSELHGQRLAHALMGAIRHESFLESGNLDDAERAATQYTVALKGLRSNLRLKAMLLGELGLLHTAVGNYRLALSYLDQREKLPYIENTAGLAVRLARARCLLHTEKEAQAAAVADEALAMTEKAPKLADYRRLALDRAALYNLAAGRFPQALARYDTELPLLAGDATAAAARNALAVRLGHAAAALGARQPAKTLADVAAVQAGLDRPALATALCWKHSTPEQTLRAYRSIADGLEANALLQLGRDGEAAQALQRREELIGSRLTETQRDADERAMILVQDRLAAQAAATNAGAAAARWAARALDHADSLGKLTASPLATEQADALWVAGELAALGGRSGSAELAGRLGKALDTLAGREDPSWTKYRRWFELCLALAAPPQAAAAH